MHVQAEHGAVRVKIGTRFAVTDAARLREAVESFAPVSVLVVDFTGVREFHDAAFLSLADMLRGARNVPVTLKGLTLHQTRLLSYLRHEDPAPIADARQRGAAAAEHR